MPLLCKGLDHRYENYRGLYKVLTRCTSIRIGAKDKLEPPCRVLQFTLDCADWPSGHSAISQISWNRSLWTNRFFCNASSPFLAFRPWIVSDDQSGSRTMFSIWELARSWKFTTYFCRNLLDNGYGNCFFSSDTGSGYCRILAPVQASAHRNHYTCNNDHGADCRLPLADCVISRCTDWGTTPDDIKRHKFGDGYLR